MRLTHGCQLIDRSPSRPSTRPSAPPAVSCANSRQESCVLSRSCSWARSVTCWSISSGTGAGRSQRGAGTAVSSAPLGSRRWTSAPSAAPALPLPSGKSGGGVLGNWHIPGSRARGRGCRVPRTRAPRLRSGWRAAFRDWSGRGPLPSPRA